MQRESGISRNDEYNVDYTSNANNITDDIADVNKEDNNKFYVETSIVAPPPAIVKNTKCLLRLLRLLRLECNIKLQKYCIASLVTACEATKLKKNIKVKQNLFNEEMKKKIKDMDKIIAMPMRKSIKKRKNITNLHLKKKKINIDFNGPSCKRCMQKRFVSREKRMRVCRFCSKSLSTNYSLMRHIKTFHKTTPTNRKQYCHGKIVCRFCNKSLSTNYCLNRHIKTFHKTTSTNKKRYCHGKICKR